MTGCINNFFSAALAATTAQQCREEQVRGEGEGAYSLVLETEGWK